MTNPLVDLVGDRTGRIVAVYPQSEIARLHSWDVDRLVAEALRRVMKVRGFADPVPADIQTRYKLLGRSDAYRGIHRPCSMAEAVEARRRLVFDELLRKAHIVGTPGSGFGPSGEGYFRLSAFNSTQNVDEAITRIQKAFGN